MESFLSSTHTGENITVSTPNRQDCKKPGLRFSPIPGNGALFRQSEISDSNFSAISQSSALSTYQGNYTARSSRLLSNCLEISKIRNFGYVNIQSTRNLPIVIRNRYSQFVMLGVKISGESDSDAFKITNTDRHEFGVASGRETMINVSFTPTKRTTYSRLLVVTVFPDRRSGLLQKKYEVSLLGHGGTAVLRIAQIKHGEELPVTLDSRFVIRSNGQFDARFEMNRTASFSLKNSGERAVFAYFVAVNEAGESLPPKTVSITPNQVLLNKLCYETRLVRIQILDSKLWREVLTGEEEIKLTVYSIVERQRLRLMEYGAVRRQKLEPVEGIDFTKFTSGAEGKSPFEKATLSSDDLRVFKEELRVCFIRLLAPSFPSQTSDANDAQEIEEQKFALLPLQFENDVVQEFDDDEITNFAGKKGKSTNKKH